MLIRVHAPCSRPSRQVRGWNVSFVSSISDFLILLLTPSAWFLCFFKKTRFLHNRREINPLWLRNGTKTRRKTPQNHRTGDKSTACTDPSTRGRANHVPVQRGSPRPPILKGLYHSTQGWLDSERAYPALGDTVKKIRYPEGVSISFVPAYASQKIIKRRYPSICVVIRQIHAAEKGRDIALRPDI